VLTTGRIRGPDPQAAAGGIPVRLGVVDDRRHDSVGAHAPDAMVAGIKQVDRAVGKYEQAIRTIDLQVGRRVRAVAIEARHMRPGEGVDSPVGGQPQNRLAGLIRDVDAAAGIGGGDVRIGRLTVVATAPSEAGVQKLIAVPSGLLVVVWWAPIKVRVVPKPSAMVENSSPESGLARAVRRPQARIAVLMGAEKRVGLRSGITMY